MTGSEPAREVGNASALGNDGEPGWANRKPTIVAGVDGTSTSLRALFWAAREAKLRGAVLQMVHAWQYPFEALSGAYVPPIPTELEIQQWADGVISKALESLKSHVTDLDDLEIVSRAVNGSPSRVLLDACRNADLLVVGRHHRRLVADLFIGSTSQFLVSHATCPVVVVHDGAVKDGMGKGDTLDAGVADEDLAMKNVGKSDQASQARDAVQVQVSGQGQDTGQAQERNVATAEVRGYLEELSENECFALLQSHSVGRLAILDNKEPRIFVVNYLLDGRTIAFRTDPGMKLEGASFHPVSMEIDQLDESTHEGWSVVVNGFGRDITEAVDQWSEEIRNRSLVPWVAGEKGHWVAIVNCTVSGRRLPGSAAPRMK
ncbi:MAG: universal stress protein [Actinobacteria bacterium]|nr:universal stress protein [Actinomycetota bacterium]MCL5445918.1 universal stress protein [Actinomycetota bacterium]